MFDGVAWNRYNTLTASGRGHSTDNARELGQKVHNYRSDRWIALKSFSRVSRGCFRWSCVETVRHAVGVQSGPFHRQQENRVKRSITIDPTVGSRSNVFHEFPKAVFEGVAWNPYDTLTASGRGHSTDSAREPGQKVHNYRSDRWIAVKCFSRVSGGCVRWSCLE